MRSLLISQGRNPLDGVTLIPFSSPVVTGHKLREILGHQGLCLVLKVEEGSTSVGDSQEVLRDLLGVLLDRQPPDLLFERNSWGKPYLVDSSDPRLEFNLSHSGNLTLFGFSLIGPLGVDVEEITQRKDPDRLVRRFFSSQEQEFYFSQEPEKRNRLFHDLWTRKEAVVKALGRGLGLGLGTFSTVPLDAGVCSFRHRETGEFHELLLKSLDLPEGYSGAAALTERKDASGKKE